MRDGCKGCNLCRASLLHTSLRPSVLSSYPGYSGLHWNLTNINIKPYSQPTAHHHLLPTPPLHTVERQISTGGIIYARGCGAGVSSATPDPGFVWQPDRISSVKYKVRLERRSSLWSAGRRDGDVVMSIEKVSPLAAFVWELLSLGKYCGASWLWSGFCRVRAGIHRLAGQWGSPAVQQPRLHLRAAALRTPLPFSIFNGCWTGLYFS